MTDYSSDKIRNIVLTGHSGSGKSTLAEAMLYTTNEISRIGSIAEGSTQSDFHPDEISRQHSLTLSLLNCSWNNHKINIIDTPGLTDFLGDVKSGSHVAETMLLTVDESTGVGYGADIAWEAAEEMNMPVIFALTKADLDQAHFQESLDSVSYTHLRAHETVLDLVCRLLLEKKKNTNNKSHLIRVTLEQL